MAELLPLLIAGFGLGLLHALDADHVMAVSALSNQKPGFKKALTYSAHWALGHSGVLLISGALLFCVGYAIPDSLQHVAEASVGVLLIALGLLCFWQFRKDRLRLAVHRHGDVVHTHWHDDGHTQNTERVSHKSVFVGGLHGLAGSAPALALIPAVSHGQLGWAMAYLGVFSIGATLSMLAFGVGFASLQTWLSQRYQSLFAASQHLLATASVVLGGYWLAQAV